MVLNVLQTPETPLSTPRENTPATASDEYQFRQGQKGDGAILELPKKKGIGKFSNPPCFNLKRPQPLISFSWPLSRLDSGTDRFA